MPRGPPNEIYDKNFYTKRMFCHVAIHCPRVAATVSSVSTVHCLCTQPSSSCTSPSHLHTHVLSPYVSSHSAFPCPFIPMSNWLFVRFLFQMFSATFGAFYFLILVKSVKTRKNRAVSMHITYTFRMQALALTD